MGFRKSSGDPPDRILWVVAGLLVAIGLAMVYSSSAVLAMRRYGASSHFFVKQAAWAVLGVLGMCAAARIDYRFWHRVALPLTAAAAALLVLVLIPRIGVEVNGSRRWIGIGPLVFQPAEFAKLAVVIYIAHVLGKRRDDSADMLSVLRPALIVMGGIVGLIYLEPDFGTAVAIAAVGVTVLFIGGLPWRTVATGVLLAVPVLTVMVLQAGYRKQRILAFIHPWEDPTERGFQLVQSLLALGSGGVTGLGPGEGRQKLLFLPEPHTDFIFSVIGEEAGLIGTLMVASLFAVLAWRGFRAGMSRDDAFGRYLAVGITLMIVMQALANMGVVTGLLPTKGLPLPLVSYGGSSLFMTLVAMGILLNISRRRVTS